MISLCMGKVLRVIWQEYERSTCILILKLRDVLLKCSLFLTLSAGPRALTTCITASTILSLTHLCLAFITNSELEIVTLP